MGSNKAYIDQTTDVKLIVKTNPRYFVQWNNTEKGRDSIECYERENNSYIRYINVNNPNMTIIRGDKSFDTLEELYNIAYTKSKLK